MEITAEEMVLAGIGEELGRGRGASAGHGHSRGRMKSRGEVGASRTRKQFIERIHLLPKEVQKALQQGRAQISDAPYYSTGTIQGTRAELIKLSTSEELGKTNIDNGKLGKDRHLTLSGIRVLYDATAEDGAYTDVFPADLLNGEWELEINGKKMFEKQPMRNFFDGFVGYNVNKPFGLYMLDNTKSIEPQQPIEFNISLPNAVVGFLKVFLVGTTVYGF